jgi:hypothetical protein
MEEGAMELRIQRSKQIFRRFGAADFFDGSVRSQKQFGGAELSVVVESHGISVRSGSMDGEHVAFRKFGQFALYGELVVIFAETSGDADSLVVGDDLLSRSP